MNIMFVLVGIASTCAIIALLISVRNEKKAQRDHDTHNAGGRIVFAISIALGVLFSAGQAFAQQAVHAMSGTVTAADAKAMTLTLQTDQGYTSVFQAMAPAKADALINKELRPLIAPAQELAKVGDHIVVLYVGDNSVLSAVAIKNLGSAAIDKHEGTVAGFDRHSHTVTLKGDASKPDSVILSEKTVVDTPDGVVTGMKYHPSKGDHVQIKSAQGDQAALFLALAT